MLGVDSRPQLARKVRLRHDHVRGETLLLFPEGGLRLNSSAADILKCCDGRTALEIATGLEAPIADVLELLDVLVDRGLLRA